MPFLLIQAYLHEIIQSASGLGYSAMLYFKDATTLGDEDRYVIFSRLAMLLAIAQLGIVAWIGATRIKDYWHHPADVVCK